MDATRSYYHYDNERADDWEERWSESYERVFYKNTMTGQKVWERPEIMGPLPEHDNFVPPADSSAVFTFVDRSTGRRVSVSKVDSYSSPSPDSRQPFDNTDYGYEDQSNPACFEVVSPAGRRLSITKSDLNAPDVLPPFHKPIEIIVMNEVCPDTGDIIQVHDHVYFDEKSGPTEDELYKMHEQEQQQAYLDEQEREQIVHQQQNGKYKKTGSAAAKLFASFDDYNGEENDSTVYDDVDLTTPYSNKSRSSIKTPERAMGVPAPLLPKQSSLKKAGSSGKALGKGVSFRDPRESDVRYLEKEPKCKVADCAVS